MIKKKDVQKNKLDLPIEAREQDNNPLQSSGINRTVKQLIKELEKTSKKKGVIPLVHDNDDEK